MATNKDTLAALGESADIGLAALAEDLRPTRQDDINAGVASLKNVIDAAVKAPEASPLSLVLFDTSVKPPKEIGPIKGGEIIPAGTYNIRADYTGPRPGSVRFLVNGKIERTESSSPFFLFGDAGGSPLAGSLWPGPTKLEAVPFGGKNGLGAPGAPCIVAVTVTDAGTPLPEPSPGPTPMPAPSPLIITVEDITSGKKLGTLDTAKLTAGVKYDILIEGATDEMKPLEITIDGKKTPGSPQSSEPLYAGGDTGGQPNGMTLPAGQHEFIVTPKQGPPVVQPFTVHAAPAPVSDDHDDVPAVTGWVTKADCMPRVTTFVKGPASLKSGQRYVGMVFSGQMDLRGLTDIEFIDCKNEQGGQFVIRCDDDSKDPLDRYFQNCSFANAKEDLIYGGGITLKRCYLGKAGGDWVKAKSYLDLIECYGENVGSNTGAHGDAVQVIKHSYVNVLRCVFDMRKINANAALMIQSKDGVTPKHVRVIGCKIISDDKGNINYAFNGDSDKSTCMADENVFDGVMKAGLCVSSAVAWGKNNTWANGKSAGAKDKKAS